MSKKALKLVMDIIRELDRLPYWLRSWTVYEKLVMTPHETSNQVGG